MKDHWPAFLDVALTLVPPAIAVVINRSMSRAWPASGEPWLLAAGIVIWGSGCMLGVGAWYHVDRPGQVNSADVVRAIGTLWTSILLLGAGAFLMIWPSVIRIARFLEHQRLIRLAEKQVRKDD